VLTISDSCHAGQRVDASGPVVRDRLVEAGHLVDHIEVLPDERARIASRLREMAQSGEMDVIFTTGGTGVAPRDVTPEATADVIDRPIPGIGERMRADGLKHTPLASLSRGIAGTCGRVLILNLPGSPKGARESLDAILELVPHMVRLLHGDTKH
jgi:molybdenum cofactor synthesis domain-containing protein